ncbi:Starch synthase, catalytic domain containing protein [Parasponia andersonii]|uniref:starch synthase n=1 Tax=Parasponia andersonii TaxID=3476 RepID=A0A2P5AID1_PARAD|nr:Starch synthase, catalytic domain containing protein [Parasponia andersonii]
MQCAIGGKVVVSPSTPSPSPSPSPSGRLFNFQQKRLSLILTSSKLKIKAQPPRLFSSASALSSFSGVDYEQIVWPSPTDEIPFWNKDFPSSDAHLVVEQVNKDHQLIHITHVTAEMAPIAKVGGLGDVVTGLARASLSRGHTVDIMLPFYECIPKHHINDFTLITTYNSYHDGDWIPTNAFRGLVSGIPIIFIEPSNHFFKGTHVYGGSYNELEAYLFFSRACLEWMQVTGTQPDIIHIHEWQTGALPLLFWDIYHSLSLKKPRIVLTIHNMEHFGECSAHQLSKCGLDGSMYATIDKAVDDRTLGHNPERLSLLKGGIVYSNAVVTVSPTYLKETMCSGWLSNTLVRNRHKYSGILNGIDTAIWNPAFDVFLPAKFHAQNSEGKKLCKYFVQRGLGLASVDHVSDMRTRMPLVVCITRLVAQKGLHLIIHAIKRVEELGGQMIVLGKAPDGSIQREFEGLAKLVPVVRKTGGLADTVFDMDDQPNQEMANGFVFEGIGEASLDGAFERAFSYFKNKPDKWNSIVRKVMEIDNSWNNTAGKYIEVYNAVTLQVLPAAENQQRIRQTLRY